MRGRIVSALGLLTSLLIPAPLDAVAQSLQFAREEVSFAVFDSSCNVTADYTFRNISDLSIRQTLFYPLPVHQSQPFPDSLTVVDAATGAAVPYAASANGISFAITIAPRVERRYGVRFTQRTPLRSLEYILTTTRAWARPLDYAKFSVTMSSVSVLASSTFRPDRQTVGNGKRVYVIEKRQFMPDCDLVIRWERKSP
jgi:hypothetical protein